MWHKIVMLQLDAYLPEDEGPYWLDEGPMDDQALDDIALASRDPGQANIRDQEYTIHGPMKGGFQYISGNYCDVIINRDAVISVQGISIREQERRFIGIEILSFWRNFRYWLHRKCHFDNFLCSQLQKIRQNVISVSVYPQLAYSLLVVLLLSRSIVYMCTFLVLRMIFWTQFLFNGQQCGKPFHFVTPS